MEKLRHAADRILGFLRIGGVSLLSFDRDRGGKAAAAADLDLVAQASCAGRFADERGGEILAAPNRPLQELRDPVDRGPFLVTGDEEGQTAAEAVSSLRQEPQR